MLFRHLFTAMISALIVFGFPVYSPAQVDHSGHGPARTSNFQENRRADNLDPKTPVPGSPGPAGRLTPSGGGNIDHGEDHSGDGGHDSGSQAAGKPDHGGDNPVSHSDSQPGHGGHGSAGKAAEKPGKGGHESGGKSPGGTGHGGDSDSHGGSGASELDPVRNTLLGGFALFNALVIAVAAILKKKALKGGAE